MTSNTPAPPLLLVAGHWLGAWAWAWDDVVAELTARGLAATALTLPGLDAADPDRASRTLDDQVTALRETATACGAPVIIAAHSGANAPVSILMDRHPGLVARVVWVDSGPATPGASFSPDFPEDAADLPLPEFAVLAEQASLEGIGAADLERFRAMAVPQPGPVLREPVLLTNATRYAVPSTFVCCSISSEQVQQLVQAGHPMFADVAHFTRVDYVDLPTGHWPMWSRPAELAEIIGKAMTPAPHPTA